MNRRDFLRLSSVAMGAYFASPFISFANANTEKRFIFIIQRGAADGLNTVIPYADPAYQNLRGALAIDAQQAFKLDGMFCLHPALKETANLYAAGQAMFVQAVASPYRERSHFDGQNILESGGLSPYQLKDGWMNRLLSILPAAQNEAIAFAPTVPLALRGKADVISHAPTAFPQPTDDLLIRVSQLYAEDAELNRLWSSAMEANNMADGISAKQDPASLGKMAAGFLSKANGPRIAMIETFKWDTHSDQNGRLNRQLESLDILIAALKQGLADDWKNTTILVATEFGRTAATNGTGGTDHGTGAAAMLLGGDIKGGRVIADWPGLNNASLYQGRDLKPTTDLTQLIASLLSERFKLDYKQISQTLYPNQKMGQAITGFM